jgi:hypothetical protein
MHAKSQPRQQVSELTFGPGTSKSANHLATTCGDIVLHTLEGTVKYK